MIPNVMDLSQSDVSSASSFKSDSSKSLSSNSNSSISSDSAQEIIINPVEAKRLMMKKQATI